MFGGPYPKITALVKIRQAVTAPDVLRAGKPVHDATVDIYEIRRANLRALCEQRAGGHQAKFSEKLDRIPNLISRYLNNKPIGAPFARHVEEALELPAGWMDTAQDGGKPSAGGNNMLYGIPLSRDEALAGREWGKLDEPFRAQVLALIETMVADQKARQRHLKHARGGGGGPVNHPGQRRN